jgi:hypothetical protein
LIKRSDHIVAAAVKRVWLLSLIATVIVALFGFLAPPASATSPLRAQTRLAVVDLSPGQLVGPHRPAPAVQSRERAPNHDQAASGFYMGAPVCPPVVSSISWCHSRAKSQSYDHPAIDSPGDNYAYDPLYNASGEARLELGPTFVATTHTESGPAARISDVRLRLAAEGGAAATPAGRVYSWHYLNETGPLRNIPGSVVDETIDQATDTTQLGDRTIYYDAKNDVTVVQSDTTGKIMSVRRGAP